MTTTDQTTTDQRTTPLPIGFGVVFDQDTTFVSDNLLYGGSPARLMRISAAGRDALAELRAGTVRSSAGARLARTLTDAGIMHPQPLSPSASPSERLNVTVVVPVRDRPRMLARCLDALGREQAVLVVDDGSARPDQIAAVCVERGATLIRRQTSGGPAAARNDGLAHVHSDAVLFLDSDTVAPRDLARRLAAHLADPMVAAVAARITPLDKATLDTAATSAGRYACVCSSLDLGDRDARVAAGTRVAYVPTAALLVRRSALLDVARDTAVFDTGLRYGEDVDLIWRLTGAGWRVRYDASVRVGHEEPARWLAMLARRFRYGTSAGPLARRHPDAMAPVVLHAWPALTVAATLARRPLLAVAAFAGSAVSTGRPLHCAGVPPTRVARGCAAGVFHTWLATGRAGTQLAAPLLAGAVIRALSRTLHAAPGRRMARLPVASASLLLGPPLIARRQLRPPLDPVRFVLGHLADEAAYGLGVWSGSIRARTAVPLRPRVIRGTLRAPAPR